MRRVAVGLSLLLLASCSANSAEVVTATTTTTVPARSAASSASSLSTATGATPGTSSRSASSGGAMTSTSKSTPPATANATGSTATGSTSTGTGTTSPSAATTSCAQQALAGLTEKRRVGQLLMVGVQPGDLVSQLPDEPIGGVFLAGHTTDGSDALAVKLAAVQKSLTRSAGVPAQIAVDQEGGYVQSLTGPDFPSIPTAVTQGLESSSDLGGGTTAWATRLVNAGVTLDLAPVADVVPTGTANENPPIGAQDRQYGSTPGGVGDSVVTVIRSMLGAKLGTTVKHFPGLGRVRANTDTSADAVDSQTTSTDPALDPFKAAIAAHTTAVMISSAMYPQLDPDHIAAFSTAIITGLLRQKMQFSGLVISDDLGGALAVSTLPAGQRAVDFVRAGGDMVLTVQAADIPPMTSALTLLAARDQAFRARVDNAALHVLVSKQAVGLLGCD